MRAQFFQRGKHLLQLSSLQTGSVVEKPVECLRQLMWFERFSKRSRTRFRSTVLERSHSANDHAGLRCSSGVCGLYLTESLFRGGVVVVVAKSQLNVEYAWVLKRIVKVFKL